MKELDERLEKIKDLFDAGQLKLAIKELEQTKKIMKKINKRIKKGN